ncbi:MAG: helix-turn-helix domain-containing protein [Arcicella sp.]|jgi:transcriptional regulator with XRE-family HTH domain|nr:helix-turn-helix domain-containing protein [Microscillaceae bacterium]MCU0471177.1 helix-turn-helix domain-containing protein [Arcicella sp.]
MEKSQDEKLKAGQKIKKIRELRNYTQDYMAKKLNLSLNGYGKIEREETEISLNRLQEIADVLQVKIFDLLGFDENKLFFNQNSHDNSTGANIVLQQPQAITDGERKQYESRITDLQKEIDYLRGMLEKTLPK